MVRARTPDREGDVESGGVAIHYEVHGSGSPTVLLVPPSPITHAQIWKTLLPHLARRNRVVTFDGRGNGRSGRPTVVEDHSRAANVADIVAVLDATGTEEAVVVTLCDAAWWALDLIAGRPERVVGFVALEPGVPHLGGPQAHWAAAVATWDAHLEDPQGWQLYNRHVITTDHRRWVEFFFDAQLVEPHSTKQLEDAVGWALESTGEILAASEEGHELDPPTRDEIVERCRRIGVPVLVVHGDRDVCQNVDKGQELAELTGGELVVLEGAGHLALVRDPVRVNRAVGDFVGRLSARPAPQRWTRAASRTPRVLYVSSPIGLGHVRRDLAITDELRRLRPDVEVDWLAQDPVTAVLQAAGERVHPASRWLASESGHLASEADGHDLHCFQALRRMDEILVANFMVFQEAVESGLYDVVVGDEAWDVDHFWHENPELKRAAHVWFTDFVGFLPMPDGGAREAALTADYNAEMVEHVARFPRVRDRAVFVGNPEDVVPDSLGPGLPTIRDWTQAHFDFCGYVTGDTPLTDEERAQWRARLGYHDDEHVCVVTVGGSGVGRALLDLAVAAFPHVARAVPGFRMVAVAGPRIDDHGFPQHRGLDVRGFVPDLYRHLAVCDLAVVQGGLATTMELAAAQRPFLYFPLLHHFEQSFHVRHRLERYRAGTCMDFATTDPESLADAMVRALTAPVRSLAVETDGAARAARLVVDLL